MIIFLLLGMLVGCQLVGLCLIPRKSKILNQISIQIGYAYLLISFYLLFVLIKNPLLAIALAFLLPILMGAYKLISINNIQLFSSSRGEVVYKLTCLLIVIGIASWPYIISGIGNYWHVGNMDMEDGILGRDAYLQGLIFNEPTSGIFKWDQERYPTQGSPYFLWYAGDEIRFQYSNLAFWSYLLQLKTGLDIVILNLLLNLSMMALGTFTLAKYIFNLSNIRASISSIACVASSFYLGTFWSGHIGSNMYDALFPAIVFLFLTPRSLMPWRLFAPSILLLVVALLFTYHQALIIGMGYLIAYKIFINGLPNSLLLNKLFPHLHARYRAWIFWFISTAVCLFLAGYLWKYTEVYRIHGLLNYRAWGVVNYYQIIPIFLGIVTYPFPTLITAKALLPISLACIYSFIILFSIFIYKGKNHLFLKIFLTLWILGIFFFYTFIGDSYYIYKYLYTHQFLLTLGFCSATFHSNSKLLKFFGLTLLIINLISDLGVGKTISNLEINQDARMYEEILALDREKLSLTYLDLGISERMVVRQILKRNGVEPKTTLLDSEYVAVHKGTLGEITGEQLGEIVFQTNKLDIRRSPKNNILTFKTTFSEPEFTSSPNSLRWMKDGNDDYLALFISKVDLSKNHHIKYLRFCTEKGPSSSRNATLKVVDAEKNVLKEVNLGIKGCAWIPAEQIIAAHQPIIFKTGERGSSLPFPEDRKLMYRIALLGWVETINDPSSEAFIKK